MLRSATSAGEVLAKLTSEHFRLSRAIYEAQQGLVLRYFAERSAKSRADGRARVTGALAKDRARLRSELLELIAGTQIDGVRFMRELWAAYRQGSDGKGIGKALQPLRDRIANIEAEAALIPSSIEKARVFLRTCAEHFGTIEAVNWCAPALPPNHHAVETLLEELRSDTIPSAQLGTEDEHSLGWHVFISKFGAGEVKGKKLCGEIEVGFRRSLQSFASDIQEWQQSGLAVDVAPAAWLLWLIGNSQELSRTLQADVFKLVDVIATVQGADGAWRTPTHTAGERDATGETTALCLLALARLPNRARYSGSMDRAAVWLCDAQRDDGAWTPDGRSTSPMAPNVLTTAIARHALVASVHDAGGHVTRAETFLLTRQEPLGSWNQRPWWTAFVTAAVTASLAAEWPDIPPAVTNNYLRTARELLPKASLFLTSANPADYRLGIIALYHGLEALLYGCFVQPQLSISIWQPKQTGQTIGLREALSAFRDRNEPAGSVGPALKFEQQVRGLAALRDAVVHRSDDVSREAANETLRDVASFVKAHAIDLLPEGVSLTSVWPWISTA